MQLVRPERRGRYNIYNRRRNCAAIPPGGLILSHINERNREALRFPVLLCCQSDAAAHGQREKDLPFEALAFELIFPLSPFGLAGLNFLFRILQKLIRSLN